MVTILVRATAMGNRRPAPGFAAMPGYREGRRMEEFARRRRARLAIAFLAAAAVVSLRTSPGRGQEGTTTAPGGRGSSPAARRFADARADPCLHRRARTNLPRL